MFEVKLIDVHINRKVRSIELSAVISCICTVALA